MRKIKDSFKTSSETTKDDLDAADPVTVCVLASGENHYTAIRAVKFATAVIDEAAIGADNDLHMKISVKPHNVPFLKSLPVLSVSDAPFPGERQAVDITAYEAFIAPQKSPVVFADPKDRDRMAQTGLPVFLQGCTRALNYH